MNLFDLDALQGLDLRTFIYINLYHTPPSPRRVSISRYRELRFTAGQNHDYFPLCFCHQAFQSAMALARAAGEASLSGPKSWLLRLLRAT